MPDVRHALMKTGYIIVGMGDEVNGANPDYDRNIYGPVNAV